MPTSPSVVGPTATTGVSDTGSRAYSYPSVRIGRGNIHSQTGRRILCTSTCMSKKQGNVFICKNICCDRIRVGVHNDSRIGGMGDSRHCADVGDSSHIEGEGSSHVRGGAGAAAGVGRSSP